ncbi:MAG: hypothetical protein CMJ58_10635 [Planctomycetaceae bacterium]|nr:hypothetical protein [Planctomycetaceae bacterium]
MLAASASDVGRAMWPRIAERTQLPWPEGEYLALSGQALASGHSRRKYHRFHLRYQAILRTANGTFAAYSKDVSRMGVGVLAPRQLFPSDEIELLLPDKGWLKLTVRRCRRLAEGCYEIGTEFADGILMAGRYKELLYNAR